MATVLALEQAINERIHQCTENIAAEFRRSVRPIYGTVDGLRPELFGSCLLLSVDGTKYVVTAAHLMDSTATHSLHVAGLAGTLPVQILGKITGTTAPSAGRGADKIDVAFWPVPEPKALALGPVSFLGVESVSTNHKSPIGHVYMAMGFPISRNRGAVNNQQRSIKSTLRKYSAAVVDLPALASDLGISGNDHLFLEYNKYQTNREGKKVNAVNPTGMSGGAIVDLGNFASMDYLDPSCKCVGHISGMLIERHQKHAALVAIKIHKIIEAIRIHRNAP